MTAAALLALLAPLTALPQEEGWRAIPLPSLCHPPARAPRALRLETGRHVNFPGEDVELRGSARPATLSVPVLLGLLQDDAAQRDLSVRFHPSAPPLLVSGNEAEVAAVRQLVQQLDRAGRELDVELRAWLAPGVATGLDRAAFEAQVADASPWGEALVRSGGWTAFGRRHSRGLVLSYSAEVATDAGVADPELGRVLYGDTLHVRACRALSGRAVHIEGLLDLATLAEVRRFDPGTPDIGVLEQPVVDTVQVAFAGVVPSGGLLAVTVRGGPMEPADRTLWIEATTTPDPVRGEPGVAGAWRAVDLALLETRVVDLPMPAPGAGLDHLADLDEDLAVLSEAFPASAVAQAGEMARSTRGRPLPVWTEGYLLVPAGDGALWEGVRAVVDAVEQERTRAGRVLVRRATLEVSLPVTAGYPARVLAGREQTRLVDFDTHVAQESWMPVPRVEPVFDGLALQMRLSGDTLVGSVWIAASPAERSLDRAETRVGHLQLLDRSFSGGRVTVPFGARRTALVDGERGGVQVELTAP